MLREEIASAREMTAKALIAKDEGEAHGKLLYDCNQQVIIAPKAAVAEGESKMSVLTRMNDANANAAMVPLASAEASKTLITRIDTQWRTEIDEERRMSIEAQKECAAPQERVFSPPRTTAVMRPGTHPPAH